MSGLREQAALGNGSCSMLELAGLFWELLANPVPHVTDEDMGLMGIGKGDCKHAHTISLQVKEC